jgi:protochlorophyllide reductase
MRSIAITGANVGIGLATAMHVAADPQWHVVLACRDPDRGEAAATTIRAGHPSASVEVVPLDLYSLASVAAAADALSRPGRPPLHALVLNAGGIDMRARVPELTGDGFEKTFQLNFLGHFALARRLVDRLAEPARIVFVSSDLHDPRATKMGRFAPPRFGPIDDAATARGDFAKQTPMARYATAKMFAMMCAYELQRRHAGARALAVCSWSPGVVPDTQAGRDMSRLMKSIMMSRWFVRFMGSRRSSLDEAGRNLGALATDPAYDAPGGRYYFIDAEATSSIESRDEVKARAVFDQAAALIER